MKTIYGLKWAQNIKQSSDQTDSQTEAKKKSMCLSYTTQNEQINLRNEL